MRFHFIVTTRNAAKWTERCLRSLVEQQEQEFTITFVDDASEDGTYDVAERFFYELDEVQNLVKVNLCRNTERRGAPPNQCFAIEKADPDPDDVIVIVDGDDYLAHNQVLNVLARHYRDPLLEVTYGSYEPDPPSHTCQPARPYPKHVGEERSFRHYTRYSGCCFNHLRTFRYRAFAQIDQDANFKWEDGTWFDFGVDFAFMMPLLEIAGTHYKFIPDILLRYNSENPASDWRRSAREADRIHLHVLSLPPVRSNP